MLKFVTKFEWERTSFKPSFKGNLVSLEISARWITQGWWSKQSTKLLMATAENTGQRCNGCCNMDSPELTWTVNDKEHQRAINSNAVNINRYWAQGNYIKNMNIINLTGIFNCKEIYPNSHLKIMWHKAKFNMGSYAYMGPGTKNSPAFLTLPFLETSHGSDNDPSRILKVKYYLRRPAP